MEHGRILKDLALLICLTGIGLGLILFSSEAKEGAVLGLGLAQNTIIPSLLPLLIIFLTIMKTGAGELISRLFGFVTAKLFNLPPAASTAIIFGLTGGYPTGALLTKELLIKNEIDGAEAKRLLRFNFCGGCGFIITAVGAITIGNIKVGLILFSANVLSAVTIGIALSFTEKRIKYEYFSFCEAMKFSDALSEAVNSAVNSVLNITAYIIIFSALDSIINIPSPLLPLFEITNGVCTGSFSIPTLSAYLAFGGISIHFQLLPIISKAEMKYGDFLLFRCISAGLSYIISKALLLIFPIDTAVFANSSTKIVSLSSVNLTLSALMIIGCFVLVLDLSSKTQLTKQLKMI